MRRPFGSVFAVGFLAFGFGSLSCILGASAIYFDLPCSAFLRKAFAGGRAWYEQRQVALPASHQPPVPVAHGMIDKPEKTFDGFTLYTCATQKESGTQAFLVDMRGELVHRWAVSFSDVWPNAPHLHGRIPDSGVSFFACHLYTNGDLLVVFHGHIPHGCGLAKLDKDSNVIWKYAGDVHHDVDVAEDGTIYAIQSQFVHEMPPGLEFIPTPCQVDSLISLSPAGQPLAKPISILEAFRATPYEVLLTLLTEPVKHKVSPGGLRVVRIEDEDEIVRRDPLHTNCVRVLTRELAPRFPMFRPGQVLISIRHLNALAVLDTKLERVVWAARGPWTAQHDPHFLDNGHLLLFDNLGLPSGSRVLEYDPATQAVPWTYSGEPGDPFYTSERGMCQRLPNGNTLIVESEGGRMIEVTADKEVVWVYTVDRFLTSARRYGPEQLQFIESGRQARRSHSTP